MIKNALTIWILGISVAVAQNLDQNTEQAGGGAKPVQVRSLESLLTPVVYTAPAEVVSANRSRLNARIEATIDSLQVDVGDRVEPGQKLVALDCTDHELARQRAEAELQSARARLQRADQQLARSVKLARDSLLSEDLLEQRQTEQEAARADARQAAVALDQARVAVQRCTIRSPFSGVVTERLAARGELARPGTPLLEIVDLESVEIAAQVFPAEQQTLVDSPRLFFLFLDQDYPVRMDRSVPVIDPVTRNIQIRLQFTGERTPVGASGRLVWHDRNPGIPASLLVQRERALGIFIAREGKAVFHHLPDAREGRPAVVDLAPDTQVVTDGRGTLREGDHLELVK